jgi:hypothetical protein
MFGFIGGIIGMAIGVFVGLTAFGFAREYVRSRLRFVDAVRHPLAPWIAGGAVVLVATPVVALLPIVGGGTALIAGAATGLGTASGVKAIRSGD